MSRTKWIVAGVVLTFLLLLDTLTAAPPAADCDDASERGRMKVDIANDLLYICTITGWVAK